MTKCGKVIAEPKELITNCKNKKRVVIDFTDIEIGDYTFIGPYMSTDLIEDRSGVYAVICIMENKRYLLDVGESAQVKTWLDTHDRRDCWEKNCQGTLAYSVKYTPNLRQKARQEIEQKIRDRFDPPCGKT